MAKKILYFLNFLGHRRAYQTMQQIEGVEQLIVGPKPKTIGGILEDYSKFNIKNIKTYSNVPEAQKIIDSFSPDVFVMAEYFQNIVVSSKCKKVVIGHGFIGDHVTEMIRRGEYKFAERRAELYCDADGWFERNAKLIGAKGISKFVQNAMPQLDLLHDPDHYMSGKSEIMAMINRPLPEKVILFCGFCCKDRADFKKHNENYFETILELEKIAKKNNWLIMVKPRQKFKKTMSFLDSGVLGGRYKKIYPSLIKSEFLHFIDYENSVYKFFFADAIIVNGCSSVELEACVAGKPLIIVRTRTGTEYDPFKTVSSGAASVVKIIGDIEQTLLSAMADETYIQKQKDLLINRGMIIDGMAHKRVQDAILAL